MVVVVSKLTTSPQIDFSEEDKDTEQRCTQVDEFFDSFGPVRDVVVLTIQRISEIFAGE